MSTLTIASWNINSVRLRAPQIVRMLESHAPDIVCLQEIKCMADEFPAKAFIKAGYPYHMIRGQKGMHGVAIVSRLPLQEEDDPDLCPRGEARLAFCTIAGITICNFYVPAGGDIPDPAANDKFAHKLEFLDRMQAFFKKRRAKNPDEKIILTGDLNIAPGEFDVWSHKQLLKIVSHTPVEVAALAKVQEAGAFIDVARIVVPNPEPVFTWWSYRSKDWTKNNRGRRLDHIWVSPALEKTIRSAGQGGFAALSDCRSWERPSDHIPILSTFKVK